MNKIEVETYPQEMLAEEEPRYLRRQKPIEIKRRKFGRKAWKSYLRVAFFVFAFLVVAGAIYGAVDFLLTSPRMALMTPDLVEVFGNHNVSRDSVLEIFAADRGRSVLRIPLAKRRAELEALPWVEHATVRRALPNRIQVNIVERTPVAFLRQGSNLALVDEEGVILDRPLEGSFNFPVVTGISSTMPLADRALRMQLFVKFMEAVDQVRSGASEWVSEVDLSRSGDLRATLAGLPGMTSAGTPSAAANAIFVHFGNSDFRTKFQVLLNNIGQWESAADGIASVDLRFEKEVVVNPETPRSGTTSSSPQGKARTSARGTRTGSGRGRH